MNNQLHASYNYAKSQVEVFYDIEDWNSFYLGWSTEPVSNYAQLCARSDFTVMYNSRGLWNDPEPLSRGEKRYYYAVDIYSYGLLASAFVERRLDALSE